MFPFGIRSVCLFPEDDQFACDIVEDHHKYIGDQFDDTAVESEPVGKDPHEAEVQYAGHDTRRQKRQKLLCKSLAAGDL